MKLKEVAFMEPLQEGEIPKSYSIRDGKIFEIIPEACDMCDHEEEVRETEKYYISGKEEYWGFETICKKCGVSFMAYKKDGDSIMNYCPGCGEKLV